MPHRKSRAAGFALGGLFLLCPPLAASSERTPAVGPPTGSEIVVPGDVALSSLIALTDGYLKKIADLFSMFALTEAARSADWEQIRPPLTALAHRNIDALVWFAQPNGHYWSVQQGESDGNLSDRPYFARVLAGETVVGPLVVSKATGKASAIVAAPIIEAGEVVGVLGASVYLDQLSERLTKEMSIGEGMIFYSFDETPLLALVWEPQLILVDPLLLGPEVAAAFEYMLAREGGTVRYQWSDRWRTAAFRRSDLTRWWYVVGVVGGHSAAIRSR